MGHLLWGCPQVLPSPCTPSRQDPCHGANTPRHHRGGVTPGSCPSCSPWSRPRAGPRAAPASPAPLHPAHPVGHPAGILIFPEISRGAGASVQRQQVTNKIFPLSRALGMGLSLKMQSSAVPTSTARPPLRQPLDAEHPASPSPPPRHRHWTPPNCTRRSPLAVPGCWAWCPYAQWGRFRGIS